MSQRQRAKTWSLGDAVARADHSGWQARRAPSGAYVPRPRSLSIVGTGRPRFSPSALPPVPRARTPAGWPGDSGTRLGGTRPRPGARVATRHPRRLRVSWPPRPCPRTDISARILHGPQGLGWGKGRWPRTSPAVLPGDAPAPRQGYHGHLAERVPVPGAGHRPSDPHSRDPHLMLVLGGPVLGALAVLALLAGWCIAGRILRPPRGMTRALQDLSTRTSIDEIGRRGPADELTELADTFDRLLPRLRSRLE